MASELPPQKQEPEPIRIRVGFFGESRVTGEVIGIAELIQEAMKLNPGEKIVSMEFVPK